MPTKRQTINRARHTLDDFKLAELMTLQAPLIDGGFYDPYAPGTCCSDMRDTIAIERCWRERELELLRLWISGWQPATKWAGDVPVGRPGSRPHGWWVHCSREERRRGETQSAYLTRLDLWLE